MTTKRIESPFVTESCIDALPDPILEILIEKAFRCQTNPHTFRTEAGSCARSLARASCVNRRWRDICRSSSSLFFLPTEVTPQPLATLISNISSCLSTHKRGTLGRIYIEMKGRREDETQSEAIDHLITSLINCIALHNVYYLNLDASQRGLSNVLPVGMIDQLLLSCKSIRDLVLIGSALHIHEQPRKVSRKLKLKKLKLDHVNINGRAFRSLGSSDLEELDISSCIGLVSLSLHAPKLVSFTSLALDYYGPNITLTTPALRHFDGKSICNFKLVDCPLLENLSAMYDETVHVEFTHVPYNLRRFGIFPNDISPELFSSPLVQLGRYARCLVIYTGPDPIPSYEFFDYIQSMPNLRDLKLHKGHGPRHVWQDLSEWAEQRTSGASYCVTLQRMLIYIDSTQDNFSEFYEDIELTIDDLQVCLPYLNAKNVVISFKLVYDEEFVDIIASFLHDAAECLKQVHQDHSTAHDISCSIEVQRPLLEKIMRLQGTFMNVNLKFE